MLTCLLVYCNRITDLSSEATLTKDKRIHLKAYQAHSDYNEENTIIQQYSIWTEVVGDMWIILGGIDGPIQTIIITTWWNTFREHKRLTLNLNTTRTERDPIVAQEELEKGHDINRKAHDNQKRDITRDTHLSKGHTKGRLFKRTV